MRVHHLNCVSACPLGGLLMDGVSAGKLRGRLSSHCLLLELQDALVLVDTGYGIRDVANPGARLSRTFLRLLRPELREEMTAARQIVRLGFDPRDVRHILLSHLDFDHAGGLDDFPGARVHLLANEVGAAIARRTVLDRMRYRPAQWGTRALWRTYTLDGGAAWRGFSEVRELDGLGPEILMVPLLGHTLGHVGFAVQTGPGWLVYAADAYFFHAEMNREQPYCTPGLRAYQRMMEKDRPRRLANQERLRSLRAEADIELFCAHDVTEFERLSGRTVGEAVEDPRGSPALPTGAPLHTSHGSAHGSGATR